MRLVFKTPKADQRSTVWSVCRRRKQEASALSKGLLRWSGLAQLRESGRENHNCLQNARLRGPRRHHAPRLPRYTGSHSRAAQPRRPPKCPEPDWRCGREVSPNSLHPHHPPSDPQRAISNKYSAIYRYFSESRRTLDFRY